MRCPTCERFHAPLALFRVIPPAARVESSKSCLTPPSSGMWYCQRRMTVPVWGPIRAYVNSVYSILIVASNVGLFHGRKLSLPSMSVIL